MDREDPRSSAARQVATPPVLLEYASGDPVEPTPPGLRGYRLDPSGMAKFRRERVLITAAWRIPWAFLVAVGVCYGYVVLRPGLSIAAAWPALVVGISTLCALLTWDIFRAYQTAARRWEAYRLYVGEGEIRAKPYGQREVILRRVDIQKMRHAFFGRGLLLSGHGHAIFVPKGLFEYEQVQQALETWGPIGPARMTPKMLAGSVVHGVNAGLLMTAPVLVLVGNPPEVWVAAAAYIVAIELTFWAAVLRERAVLQWRVGIAMAIIMAPVLARVVWWWLAK